MSDKKLGRPKKLDNMTVTSVSIEREQWIRFQELISPRSASEVFRKFIETFLKENENEKG